MPIFATAAPNTTITWGPYHVRFHGGSRPVQIDIPELADHLRTVPGVTVTEIPDGDRAQTKLADHQPSTEPTGQTAAPKKSARIIVQ